MKRSAVFPRTFYLGSAFVILAALVGSVGYLIEVVRTWPKPDPSIVFSEPFKGHKGVIVENGSAFHQATVDLQQRRKIVLPANAEVRRDGQGERVTLFLKKTFSFHGYPSESMSIRKVRHFMGCSMKFEGDALVVATFGDWHSKEGGGHVDIVAIVPKNIEVERRDGLSDMESAGAQFDREWRRPPTEGWAEIPDEPDPMRRAESK